MSIEPRLLVIATALVTACATDENPTEPDLAPASATVDARRYLVSDLGTLGGSYSYGFGINGAGGVVGVSATAARIVLRAAHRHYWTFVT